MTKLDKTQKTTKTTHDNTNITRQDNARQDNTRQGKAIYRKATLKATDGNCIPVVALFKCLDNSLNDSLEDSSNDSISLSAFASCEHKAKQDIRTQDETRKTRQDKPR